MLLKSFLGQGNRSTGWVGYEVSAYTKRSTPDEKLWTLFVLILLFIIPLLIIHFHFSNEAAVWKSSKVRGLISNHKMSVV